MHPRTRVPVVAIVLQGALASLLALSGSYEQILGFVVAIDWVFFGLTALALVVLRRRDDAGGGRVVVPRAGAPVDHPRVRRRVVAGGGQHRLSLPRQRPCRPGLLVIGVPVYYVWRRRSGAGA